MNELQIRLTADISVLTSQLSKAKKALKDFQETGESGSQNEPLKEQVGLITALTAKIKTLKALQENAFDEKEVARYNAELEEASKELTRLNALGRTVTANLSGVGGGFSQVARQGNNANGVALEFNRIIQDAPFGLLGIGNNLQQLAGNFSQVSKDAGGAGKAIAQSFTALISPVNLGLLAISALTAGFTAYQMGAFDTILGNEEVEDSFISLDDKLKDYIETLGSVETANLNSAKAIASERVELDAIIGVIQNESETREKRLLALNKLRDLYPGYLKGLSDETILSQGLRDVYLEITDAITKRATALALEDELVNLAKERLELNRKLISDEDNFFKIQGELIKAEVEYQRLLKAREEGKASASRVALAKEERDTLRDILSTSQELANETGVAINTNKEAATQLGQEYQNIYADLLEVNSLTTEWDEGAQKIVRTYEKIGTTLDDVLQRARNQRRDDFFTGLEAPMSVESGAATTQGIIIPDDVQSKVTDNLKEQKALVDELSGAYAGLGSLIGKSFDNPQFGSFLGQFIPFVAKVVAGLFAVSTANAVAGATQSSLFTGPAAVFTLPAFIATAVGLVAGAFSSLGAGGGGSSGGGGASSSGAPPQIFTNANTVTPPSPFNPNPSGSIDFDRAQGRLTTSVSGEDIVFVYDRYKERQAGGG